MFKVTRFQRGPWMTVAALLAVIVATDPRLAHFSSCMADRAAALATPTACEPPADVECLMPFDACGCCGPASPSHRGEGDSRSTFVASGPIREGVASALFLPPESPATLPIATVSNLRGRHAPDVAPPSPRLLCQRLLM